MTAGPLIDGRPPHIGRIARLNRRIQRLLVTQAEREEAVLEQRIRSLPGVSRPNTVALLSPRGGVGKTTLTFVLGTLLATHLKLRTIAVDASPEFGTLARLAPTHRRIEPGVDDLVKAADRLHTAAELRPYLTTLASGLHILGAPRRQRPGPDDYGELVAFLSCFYDVVLLDHATGMVGPLARFAIERADQVVLVTTPDAVTSTAVRKALTDLHHHARTTLAVNRAGAHDTLAVPHDDQLAATLHSGTYALEAVRRRTRVAIKRLGLTVAERLA